MSYAVTKSLLLTMEDQVDVEIRWNIENNFNMCAHYNSFSVRERERDRQTDRESVCERVSDSQKKKKKKTLKILP